ncbi:hypothetical protein FHX82_007120 [Amycolatopsis bartoniae]|nr:hypothetical protein [Amycolatopsis bartoniae]
MITVQGNDITGCDPDARVSTRRLFFTRSRSRRRIAGSPSGPRLHQAVLVGYWPTVRPLAARGRPRRPVRSWGEFSFVVRGCTVECPSHPRSAAGSTLMMLIAPPNGKVCTFGPFPRSDGPFSVAAGVVDHCGRNPRCGARFGELTGLCLRVVPDQGEASWSQVGRLAGEPVHRRGWSRVSALPVPKGLSWRARADRRTLVPAEPVMPAPAGAEFPAASTLLMNGLTVRLALNAIAAPAGTGRSTARYSAARVLASRSSGSACRSTSSGSSTACSPARTLRGRGAGGRP